LLAGKVDLDHILPAVAVQILDPLAKHIAVAVRIIRFRFLDQRPRLPVRGQIVQPTGGDVGLAIVVEIADGDSFAAEFWIELGAHKADLVAGDARLVGLICRGKRADAARDDAQSQPQNSQSHCWRPSK
jgi:hypothetical protein